MCVLLCSLDKISCFYLTGTILDAEVGPAFASSEIRLERR